MMILSHPNCSQFRREVTQQIAPILHSDSDNLSAIRMDGHYDSYHLFAIYLADLDGKLD